MKVRTSPFVEYCKNYQHEYETDVGHPLCLFELASIAWDDWCQETSEERKYFQEIALGGIPEQCLMDHFNDIEKSGFPEQYIMDHFEQFNKDCLYSATWRQLDGDRSVLGFWSAIRFVTTLKILFGQYFYPWNELPMNAMNINHTILCSNLMVMQIAIS
jgi:hypothetical protein